MIVSRAVETGTGHVSHQKGSEFRISALEGKQATPSLIQAWEFQLLLPAWDVQLPEFLKIVLFLFPGTSCYKRRHHPTHSYNKFHHVSEVT